MNKIIVSVTNDITTDQRVHKVCSTLMKNNFEVLLIGRKLINSKDLKREYDINRFRLLFNNGFLFYAEFNFRLFFFLLLQKKTILLSNDLDTLLPNFLVSKIQNKKLVYDSHELFSEIPELVKRPFVKKCWEKLEDFMLPKLQNCYTVCDSIKNHYNQKYNCDFKTIKNLPTRKTSLQNPNNYNFKNEKIILYQGALNIGRGLELMIETMEYLENCIFIIVGDGDIYEDLKKTVYIKNLNSKVEFLGRKSPEKLFKITPNADLGISFEEDLGLNYRYALPNKIFDYIQAEVPILVSDLPEMKKIVNQYKVGEIIAERSPKFIAKQIEKLLEKDFSNELKSAKSQLVWENQEEKLLDIFNNLK